MLCGSSSAVGFVLPSPLKGLWVYLSLQSTLLGICVPLMLGLVSHTQPITHKMLFAVFIVAYILWFSFMVLIGNKVSLSHCISLFFLSLSWLLEHKYLMY